MPAKGHSLLRFALIGGIGCAMACAASAQFLEPPQRNLFGDEFVRTLDAQNNGGFVINGGVLIQRGPRAAPSLEGYEHMLIFQDGRQLRGKLESAGKEEIVWRRPDFSEPLRLRRKDVHRVFLTPEAGPTNRFLVNAGQVVIMNAAGRRVVRSAGASGTIPATLKLGGEDWLQGQITSPDGRSFVLRTDEKGGAITVPRSEVDWLYLDWNAARGGGFEGSMAGMEEWLASAPSATVSADGILAIPPGNEWFGRTLPQPRFFEISLEIPADAEQGSHLCLQPYNPSPNSFGAGTLDVEFGPKEVSVRRFINSMDQKKIPVSESGPPDARGMVRYRLFYDSDAHRLVIFRNGTNVADWKPDPPKPEDVVANPLTPQITDYVMRMSMRGFASSVSISGMMDSLASTSEGLGVDRVLTMAALANHWRFAAQFLIQRIRAQNPRITGISMTGASRATPEDNAQWGGLKLRRFRVNPWDGVLPKNGEGTLAADQLNTGTGKSISGKLESITDKEIVISNQTTPKAAGMLLRLQNGARHPFDAVAKADLGILGEIGVSTVKIEGGKAHLRTAFSDDLELPSTALSSISLSPLTPAAFEKSDSLVFKNGDELPGSLLAASPSGLRWKLPNGSEVEIEPKHIAGVRTAPADPEKRVSQEALVELRNGDRLRGAIVSFDGAHLGLKHPILGSLSVEAQRLWQVFPNSTARIRDGCEDPKSWINPDLRTGPEYYRAQSRSNLHSELSWLYFDGCYIPRQTRGQNGEVDQTILSTRVPKQDSSLFEFRAEITGTGDNSPNGLFAIGTMQNPNGAGSSIFVNFSYAEMYVNIINAQGQRTRQIPFGSKLGKMSTRLSLRIFVNSAAGTVDIMLDGVVLARLGQQADERVPGIAEIASVGGMVYDGHPLVFSNVWIGPWDGELPRAETKSRPSTTLSNGDATAAVPSLLKDGVYHLETDIGPIDVAASALSAISFGGEFSPKRSVARLRLSDGSVLHLGGFECLSRTLIGRSTLFGEVRLPFDAIREIVFDPTPIREPKGPALKKPIQTAAAGEPEKAANPARKQ